MSNKIIKINRGDSFDFTINSKELAHNEAIYFALLYPHQRFEDAILIKGYTYEDQDANSGNILVRITPNDTRSLVPGIYYYTVKFKRGGNLDVVGGFDEPEELGTLIERTKFIINE